jgi:hypothetical protein
MRSRPISSQQQMIQSNRETRYSPDGIVSWVELDDPESDVERPLAVLFLVRNRSEVADRVRVYPRAYTHNVHRQHMSP